LPFTKYGYINIGTDSHLFYPRARNISLITFSSTLYVDLEGKNLGRHVTISVITIIVHPQVVVRLIDVSQLGEQTFTIASSSGMTLKAILGDPDIPKSFWDIRNDADALWAHYNAHLLNITDIKLLENAFREGDKTFVKGLDNCVKTDLNIQPASWLTKTWTRTKHEIKGLMDINLFAKRPMDIETVRYCANNVIHLPSLYFLYLSRIQDDWLAKVKKESINRVTETHDLSYDPEGPDKIYGPWCLEPEPPGTPLDEILDVRVQQRMDDTEEPISEDNDDSAYYDEAY
jgi:exonuclease 3'-5' domain-containing protein 1